MESPDITQGLVDFLVVFATDTLKPLMFFTFFVAVVLRVLNFYTFKRQESYTKEFEKRVDKFLNSIEGDQNISFFVIAKKLLLITYYELFEITSLMKRRKPDSIMTMSDRVFLTKPGFAYLVKDVLKQIRYIKTDMHRPQFLEVSKNTFQKNPNFSKIFGVIPSNTVNDILNILPGLFIIGGIFGTFLGIMKALPGLGEMNLNDIEGSKLIMDNFLREISFSMSTSIVGIVLSVVMSIVNTFFSAEKVFMRTIDRFENSLYALWNRSDHNKLPTETMSFDEHQDPVDALAEEALNREYSRMKGMHLVDDVSVPKSDSKVS